MTTPSPTSPDITPYVDVTLYDADTQDLVDSAVNDGLSKLPGWVPAAGNTEVVVLEMLALPVAELIYRVNRMPGAVVEALLAIYGITRSPGSPASGVVHFDVSSSGGYTIPAGTSLGLTLAGTTFALRTSEDLAIPTGSTGGDVAVETVENTDVLNGTAAGSPVQVVDRVVYVERAALSVALSGGAPAEDTASILNRGAQVFSRLTSTLVTPDHFKQAALGTPGVFRATAVQSYDPGSGHAPGTDPGHVSVAVLGSGGTPVASAVKSALLAQLQSSAQANLAVHLVDPTVSTVNVTMTVTAMPGANTTTVRAAVVAALQAYLSPAQWPWSAVVRVNELIALASNVDGVDYVNPGMTPSTDQALSGAAPLASAGTITVTVNSQ